MSDEVEATDVHPLTAQFEADQEVALAAQAEALSTVRTGIQTLALEGRLEEQFSSDEAAQIEAELGEIPVNPTVEPPEGEVFTTSSPDVTAPIAEVPAPSGGDDTAAIQAVIDEATQPAVEEPVVAEPVVEEAPVVEVPEVTAEEVQEDLDHGTDDVADEDEPESPTEA